VTSGTSTYTLSKNCLVELGLEFGFDIGNVNLVVPHYSIEMALAPIVQYLQPNVVVEAY
jgi:hypothetical protein